MKPGFVVRIAAILAVASTAIAAEGEWSRFRGPNGSGISEAVTVPAKWTARDYNWNVKLPGIGHSSPVIWGERIFVTSAEPETARRLVLCLHKSDGRVLWQREYSSQTYAQHRDNCYASATPAVDATGVVLTWSTPKQVLLLALDLDGRELWRRGLGPFVAQSGSGISPILYEDLAILANDQDDLKLDPNEKSTEAGISFLIAVDRKTGQTRWQIPRPTTFGGFGTPCVFQADDGRRELFFTSTARGVTGVDPRTGSINWELNQELRDRTISSPVVASGLVFVGPGVSVVGKRLIAVRPGSRQQEPQVVYEVTRSVPMVPTPLVKDDRLFLWSDNGIVSCLRAADGKVIWSERVGGEFFGSPVWVNGRLYCIGKNGDVLVVAAADKFEVVARVPLGESSYATPAVAGGVMYLRTQSQLFSLGGKALATNTAGIAASASSAAPDWYHREGPLRGSLKRDTPLPLYHSDPEHLWNRLFAAFYIRPSELPSRPEYPKDSTKLDEWDRQLRAGKLPLGPAVKRIEGGDVPGLLAWKKTRHFSEPAPFARENKLLDEFLETRGERLITDPLKRAFLQRDLWAVFDHLVGQNIARFGDADLARRRAPVPDYGIEPGDIQRDDPAAMQRRETLCRKLAVIIKRLALPKSAIEALPDNYAAAIQSGQFASRHDFDSLGNYLPRGLLTGSNEWVEIDNLHGREGQLAYTTWSIRGRSYHRVFWRFPEGRPALESYLDYLQREGIDWEKSVREGFINLKRDVRQIPAGIEAAIIQCMIVLDEELNPIPTRVVELVHLNVYKNVTGAPDPETNTGRGIISRQYVMRRRLMFDGLKQGGLERQADDAPTYRVLLDSSRDWGAHGRLRSVVETCLGCHMTEKDGFGPYLGVFSLNSIFCFNPEAGMPGIVIPMGAGEVKAYSRAERTARWKLGQEDYLRLVEYARSGQTNP